MRSAVTAALLTLAFTSCATVQHGPLQRIQVTSEPVGGTVTTRDCGAGSTREERVTPSVVFVNRRATACEILVSLPDHFTERVPLQRQFSSATEMNLAVLSETCGSDDCDTFGEAIVFTLMGVAVAGFGYSVDLATGGAWEQRPSRVHVRLRHRLEPPEEVEEHETPPGDGLPPAR